MGSQQSAVLVSVRLGRTVWVRAAGMDGEEQGAGRREGRGTGVRDMAEECGVGWQGKAGLVGLGWRQSGAVWGAQAGPGTSLECGQPFLCPQAGDETQHHAAGAWLGFGHGGSAHLPAWLLHPQGSCLGWPSRCCRTPCPAVPCTGSAWSLLLGICPLVAPGSVEGGKRQFACLGLWLSFLPSPPPLLFLCRGDCFSPPFLFGWQGYI